MSAAGAEVRVAICDYGAGNLHSLAKALSGPATSVRIERDVGAAANRLETDLLVFPGVGAFEAAAECLAPAREAVRGAAAEGMPILGICLGMQLFFDTSEEGAGDGLGLLAGRVRRLRSRRIPQIGWNELLLTEEAEPLFGGGPPSLVYYANSFVCEPQDSQCVTAWSEHEGDRFAASVRGGPASNVVGVQFHPEKSSTAGVRLLRRLVDRARAGVMR